MGQCKLEAASGTGEFGELGEARQVGRRTLIPVRFEHVLTTKASVAIGIDVAEERKGLDVVVISRDRRIVVSKGKATVADVAALVTELRPDVVCIDSPSGWSSSGRSRAAERELRKLGITAFPTPPDPGDHAFYRWMRVGFSLYAGLAGSHDLFTGGILVGTAAEVFPEASAVLLAGRLRSAHDTKLQFRGRVLEEHGIETASLPTVDRIDAALGALTGLLALEGRRSIVGDPAEGVILLPVSPLPGARLVRAESSPSNPPPPVPTPEASVLTAQLCLCGCGATVRRRFLPGHDAKLKSRLHGQHAPGDVNATKQLEVLGWTHARSGEVASTADDGVPRTHVR